MTTTIRHVTLKSLGKNKDIDPSKGTVTNPFTQEEYNNLNQTGEWTGGYVKGEGYLAMSSEIDSNIPFYWWPTIPVWLFVEMCKQLSKGNMYELICNTMNFSQIESDYFHRYWYAEGDKILTNDEFDAIISATDNLESPDPSSVTINKKKYVYKQYDLSNDSTYGGALGTCTIFYDGTTPVGFKDDYDFDPKPWGVRESEFGELLTRAMNELGPFYGAQNYHIRYGIYN